MMKSMEDSRVAAAASMVKLGCVAVALIAIVALAGCSAHSLTAIDSSSSVMSLTSNDRRERFG